MAQSIIDLVKQFKQGWTHPLEPEMIENACREAGYVWTERMLGPVMTLQLFFLQILHGNTAMAHLPRLARMAFTASAYCQARARLPLRVFQLLLRRACDAMQANTLDDGRWRGHRTFFVDGSSFSMPDTPELQAEFGQPGAQQKGCGFPVAHLLALFHAGTGMITQVLTAPLRTHDMSQTPQLHPQLSEGEILVADRAFCSYAHLCLILRENLHAVFRMHQRQLVDFTPNRPFNMPGKKHRKGLPRSQWIRSLGALDQIVRWFKPKQKPNWMSAEEFAALPDSIVVRELRYRITRPGFRCEWITLVTTLTDAELYPSEALSQLYLDRWAIETRPLGN